MALIRLAEKDIVNAMKDGGTVLISQLEEIAEGEEKLSVRRITISTLIDILKRFGVDESHFDEFQYNSNTGYLHILLNGEDVIEPCYIGRFAEVDENGIIPEGSLPYFNKSHTLFADGAPLYGTRFVDVDENGEIIIHADGSGDYLITALEDGTVKAVRVKPQIADDLDTDSDTVVLSARQGKLLGSWIGTIANLLTTAKTNIVDAVNELFNSLKNHKENLSNPHSVTSSQIGLGNVTNDKQATKTEFDAHTGNKLNPHEVTKTQVGLGNVDNTADANKDVRSATKLKTPRKINGVNFDGTADITIEDDTKIPLSQKGVAGGVAELNESGLIPSAQLPSYVDDTIEGTLATFPEIGESGKIYVDTSTNLTYRWSGSQYVEISKSLGLGETASTAYAGNKGKKNAQDIETLKGQMTDAENDIGTLQRDKASLEFVNEELSKKADLVDGIVPDAQLPVAVVRVDGKVLYPTCFVDVTDDGDAILREDGSGDYLLHIPADGVPRLKYIGKAITDEITGVRYSLSVSNGETILKQII